MSRPKVRYHNVWQAGYTAASEDITAAVYRHLAAGGQLAAVPFGQMIAVKWASGNVAEASNLIALRPFQRDER